GSSAFCDQVDTALGQQPQFDGCVVGRTDRLQVASHTGLVGDHAGIAGVGLALAAVAVGGTVDRDAGNVDELLAVIDEQRNEKRRLAAGHVQGPGDVPAVGEVQDVADQLQQL